MGLGPGGLWWRSISLCFDQILRLRSARPAASSSANEIRALQLAGARRHLLAIIAAGSRRAPIASHVRAMWSQRCLSLSPQVDSGELLFIRDWIVEVDYTTSTLAAAAAQACKDSFHARWNLLRKGGREAFAFVREPAAARADAPDLADDGLSSAQAAAIAELQMWVSSCWLPSVFSDAAPQICPVGPLLPPITAKESDRALLSFDWPTGIGAD